MTPTIHVNRLRGRIDFTIITIREDEFEAVLGRFSPRRPVIGGRQVYEYCRFPRPDGRTVDVAVVRAFDQGQSVAQSVARDAIDDLAPRWLILAGIAGGIPDNEFSLGDVLLAGRLHDFSVTAAIEDEHPQFRPGGGPVHPAVERLLAYMPAYRDRLGDWNRQSLLTCQKPTVLVPDDIRSDCYYGADNTRKTVRSSLQRHFPKTSVSRAPLFKVGAVATANVLLKDTALLAEWRRAARDISHIEMEAGGVYFAARHARPHELPLLCVRGISDIVGFSRTPEWTPFACHVAASFLHALLSHLPLEVFDVEPRPRLSLGELFNKLPSGLGRLINTVYEVIHAAGRQISDYSKGSVVRTPTLEAIVAAFEHSSLPLLSRVVVDSERIPRPELETLQKFIAEGEDNVLCILGSPGSGKTAILALVARNAIDAGLVTLAIKADFVPTEIPFETWTKQQIGLGITALDAVKAAASRGRVLVIVDQLDALASTVDLKSERLNSVISFIAQCAAVPRVSVICSCRKFDFSHDTRFGSLNAKVIDLELPAWTEVTQQLLQHGVRDTDSWPQDFREVLRTPQHLKIYLDRIASTGNIDAFGTYYSMLDDLWARANLSSAEIGVLDALTEVLIEREILWAPLVRFEDSLSIISSLESKGILRTEAGRVGFHHQTLLEHGKARYFTKRDKSLANHVLERQSAILVRPTVWAVLRYLRDVDRSKYRVEVEGLFRADLRLHLRYLVIEFLGQVSKPEDYEIVLLGSRLLSEEDSVRVLISIRGSADWFYALRTTHLPVVMKGPPESQWPMIGVITDAWEFGREACIDLVKQNWLPVAQKDRLTTRAMSGLGQWDEQSVDIVCTLIRRADHDQGFHWAESLVSIISADQPRLASRVFKETVLRETETSHEPGRSTSQMSSPLESSRGWYDLPAVAEAAPTEFLREGWEWLVSICERFHTGYDSTVLYRYRGACFALEEHTHRPEPSLLTSFLAAIDSVAATSPDIFVEITRQSWSSENAVVHRLIVRGLCLAIRDRPLTGLEYLRGDRRRFAVGTSESHGQSDSQALIAALVPLLSVNERISLEKLILSWSQYRDGVEVIDEQREWDREARLRLLTSIPSHLLSQELSQLIESEKSALPDWDREIRSSRSGSVREVPPMSKEAMLTADNEQVLRTISASRDPGREQRTMTEVPGGWEEPGGPSAAGRELGELAKEHSQRAIELIVLLIANGQEDAAAAAIHHVPESSLDDNEVYKFVRKLASLKVQSEQVRSNVGYLLYHRCREQIGLPNDICEALKVWLAQPWDSSYGVFAASNAQEERATPESVASILWAPRHGIVDTDRSFWPLLAVTHGYLMRSDPDTKAWLDTVEMHLRRDVAERTWAAYCLEMRWIGIKDCDRARGESVISQLFARFPALKEKQEGVRLVAHISSLLSRPFVEAFLDSLRASTSFTSKQAFAELITLIAFRDKEHAWAIQRLEVELAAMKEGGSFDEPIGVGMAFVAAQLWDQPEARDKASSVLCEIVPHATKHIGEAVATVFWAKDDFVADEATESLLHTLAQNPSALSKIPITELVEHLTGLVPHKRVVVLNVCNAILKSGRREGDLFESGPHLVKIAMTLQRFDDTRADGLTLLEELLGLGLDDAFRILRDIDIRPTTTTGREPRRRRRRRG